MKLYCKPLKKIKCLNEKSGLIFLVSLFILKYFFRQLFYFFLKTYKISQQFKFPWIKKI
ncbi:hypothetical protein SLY_0538 [Strawberry lethal yellows phytoplasma (CPA) str. NZSb11]|uniref:Uncharacterized protein n=1 Tax=Strawberry lethal yellows phytoplasma (CPA) str. NZSb11 TaxID=980422 RepID=R4RX60_PHYAS|nr:hypothetical protein SLY_0538 [Strawberry lethal yellows phytoplasma (CPA) str. NZSb11]